MSDTEDDDLHTPEAVGYGRPPRHSRFKPGQSGNPSGRPKGARSLRSDLAEELSETVQVSENGRTVVVSKQRLAIKSLTTKAIKGHVPAAARLFDLVRDTQGYGDNADVGSARLSDEDDEAVITSFLARRGARSSGD